MKFKVGDKVIDSEDPSRGVGKVVAVHPGKFYNTDIVWPQDGTWGKATITFTDEDLKTIDLEEVASSPLYQALK